MSNINTSIINKAVLREALPGKGVPPNLKMSERRWYQHKNTNEKTDDYLTQTIEAINWSDNDMIINHICNAAGGYFIKAIDVDERNKCLHSNMSKILKEMSDVYVVFAAAAADGKITIDELPKIKKEINEMQQATEDFYAMAEKHYFDRG